jgi:RimJ/RimL family protein N-acetyltransferase
MEIITDLHKYNIFKKMIHKSDKELIAFDKKSTYFIYFVNSLPVGRITIQNNKNCLGIWDIFVSESMRGKGICTTMLKYIINPNNFYFLYVKDNNQAAIKCYTKFGFQIKEHKKDIYYMTYGKEISSNGRFMTLLNRLANK